MPVHDQYQGPEPEIPEKFPELQKPLVGALVNEPPFDEPHCPLTEVTVLYAEQLTVDPPFVPLHDQYQGPEPEIPLAVPELHSPELGALVNEPPFEYPHCPLTGVTVLFAEQLEVEPPFVPLHDQYQGPVPETELAVPELHKFEVGVLENVPPFEYPHCPLTGDAVLYAVQ